MSPVKIDPCPLWGLDDMGKEVCLASGEYCPLDNAETYKDCPTYRLLVRLLGVKE